jgi:hypothetical protein
MAAHIGWIVTAVLIAVGCSSPVQEPAGSTTPISQPAGPATAASALVGTDLPPGLEFRNVPEVTGDGRAALQAYLGLETEAWRSFLDAAVSPDLARYATPALVEDVEASVQFQRDHDLRGGGRMVIAPAVQRVENDIALIRACADLSEVTNIVDGVEGPPQEDLDSPTWVVEALVVVDPASGDDWKVSEHRLEPKHCVIR